MPSDEQILQQEISDPRYDGLSNQEAADLLNDPTQVTVEVNSIQSEALWAAIEPAEWERLDDATRQYLSALVNRPRIAIRGTGVIARLQSIFGNALDYLLYTTISRREYLGITAFKTLVGEPHIRAARGEPEPEHVLNVDLPAEKLDALLSKAGAEFTAQVEDVDINGEIRRRVPVPVLQALMDVVGGDDKAEMQKYLVLEVTLGHEDVGITEEARKAMIKQARIEAGIEEADTNG